MVIRKTLHLEKQLGNFAEKRFKNKENEHRKQ